MFTFNCNKYIKSSVPKGDKHHSKRKWDCYANAKFIDYVLEKSFSNHVYMHIYVHI